MFVLKMFQYRTLHGSTLNITFAGIINWQFALIAFKQIIKHFVYNIFLLKENIISLLTLLCTKLKIENKN